MIMIHVFNASITALLIFVKVKSHVQIVIIYRKVFTPVNALQVKVYTITSSFSYTDRYYNINIVYMKLML